ncbi:MAG: hypothetical protein RLP44_13280 [Aggregatilineales bacterium]
MAKMQMPDMTFKPEHETLLHELMNDIPQAKASKMFGMPAYKVNGKLATALFSKGMVVKLGADRVHEVLAEGNPDLSVFEPMTGRVWKDWLTIVDNFSDHKPIFEEAVAYMLEQTAS